MLRLPILACAAVHVAESVTHDTSGNFGRPSRTGPTRAGCISTAAEGRRSRDQAVRLRRIPLLSGVQSPNAVHFTRRIRADAVLPRVFSCLGCVRPRCSVAPRAFTRLWIAIRIRIASGGRSPRLNPYASGRRASATTLRRAAVRSIEDGTTSPTMLRSRSSDTQFGDDLEVERHNIAATRNVRLAAIDRSTRDGRRDYALLVTMFIRARASRRSSGCAWRIFAWSRLRTLVSSGRDARNASARSGPRRLSS